MRRAVLSEGVAPTPVGVRATGPVGARATGPVGVRGIGPAGGRVMAQAGVCATAHAAVLGLVLLLAACGGARPPAPIADRPIDIAGQCSQTEEDGFREQARLTVRNGRVDELSWQIWVGRRGTCRFELDEFRQVRSRPSVELLARDGGGCKLMVWQDPRRVTLAHAGCEKRCTPGVYEEAWPVMFEPGSGGCATR
jgi:hypothetical protein